MTVYAIGDIHGQLDALRASHARVAEDRARHGAQTAPLVHLGDLVDRGPDSAGVIDFIMAAMADDARVTTIRGNHDQMFLDYLTTGPDPLPGAARQVHYLWHKVGGAQTLASYDIDPTGPPDDVHAEAVATVPDAHRAFLDALPLTHAVRDCLCVHAGLRPGVPLAKQDPEDLIWIRDEFLQSPVDHGPLVVHGHTPVDRPEHHGNRLALDTGAGYGRALSVAVIEGREAFVLEDGGRVPIRRTA